MKKIIFGVLVSAAFIGCSSDGTESTEVLNQEIKPQQRTVESVYPEFANLFRTLYGSSYDVSNTTTTIVRDGGTTYKYNTVTVPSGGSTIIKGYILEVPGNILYYEHIRWPKG